MKRALTFEVDNGIEPDVKKRRIDDQHPSDVVEDIEEVPLYDDGDTLAPDPPRLIDTLIPEQRQVVDFVLANKNTSIFLTGEAGAGKSYVLRAIIEELMKVDGGDGVFVTASTGIATSDIGGRTIHSFGGLGRDAKSVDDICRRIWRSDAGDRWRAAKTLIIDEISMIEAELFDIMDGIARRIRKTYRPFGGIRLILVGDFAQLGPIARDKVARYAFESTAWESLRPRVFNLKSVHRQSDDPTFLTILSQVRRGVATHDTIRALGACLNRPPIEDMPVTTIAPLNADVDMTNANELDKLDGKEVQYVAIDSGPQKDTLLRHIRAPPVLKLKVGAQVMLQKNINVARRLFNGAIGTVVGFSKMGNLPIVDFRDAGHVVVDYTTWDFFDNNKILVATRRQIPLALAWAISSHKAQGQTITCNMRADLASVFTEGQAYTILSRVKSLSQLSLLSFSPSSIRVNPRVVEFYKSIEKNEAKNE